MVTALAAAGARLEELRSDEEGQGLTEYAFILFLVSVVAVVALTNLGKSITAILTKVAQDV
jgi:Flp pilus assembly pilin Flp